MKNRGISTILIVIIIAVVVIGLAGSGYYFFVPNNDEDDSDLGQVVSDYFDFDVSFQLEDSTDNYARGKFVIDAGNALQNIFLAKLNGEWQVAYFSDQIIPCEKLERFGFPFGMISDCTVEFPNAKDVAEVLDSGEGGYTQIIGTALTDPSGGCLTIYSGGQSVSASCSGGVDTSGVSDGDLVIVDTTVTPPSGGSGTTTVVINNVVDTSGNSGSSSGSNTSGNSSNNEEENEDNGQIIPPNPATNTPGFFQSLYDIDNSGVEVEIISDF